MTTSNYSYSHEQQLSPERMAVLARAQRVETAVKYLNDVALYTDPALWASAATETAGSINHSTPDYAAQPQTMTAGSAGTLMVRSAEQEQRLAEARRQAAEEAV